MNFLILEKSTGKIHYTSHRSNKTSDLGNLIYKTILDEQGNNIIYLQNNSYYFLSEKYDQYFFILWYKTPNFLKIDQIILKKKYLENIIKLFKNSNRIFSELETGEIIEILFKIYNINIHIDIISNNKKIIDQFFDQIHGIDICFDDMNNVGLKTWRKLIFQINQDYFGQDTNYIALNYYFNNLNGNFRESRIIHLKSLKYVIYLENEADLIDSDYNEVIDSIKESKNLKHAIMLVNNPSRNEKKITETYNTILSIEQISIEQFNTEKLLDLINRHFSEYNQT